MVDSRSYPMPTLTPVTGVTDSRSLVTVELSICCPSPKKLTLAARVELAYERGSDLPRISVFIWSKA
eukprot:scaffold3800_cov137-Pinguiococcus_pyrenoidosus.AAC.4